MTIPWDKMEYELPVEYEPYVIMIAAACSEENAGKLINRFQKVVRAVVDKAEKVGMEKAAQICNKCADEVSPMTRHYADGCAEKIRKTVEEKK